MKHVLAIVIAAFALVAFSAPASAATKHHAKHHTTHAKHHAKHK